MNLHIKEALDKLDKIVFYEDELAEGFERPVGSEPITITRINAEHLGDVTGKLIPQIQILLKQELSKAYEAGREDRKKEVIKILEAVETISQDEQKHGFTEHCSCLRYAIHRVKNPDADEMVYASSIISKDTNAK